MFDLINNIDQDYIVICVATLGISCGIRIVIWMQRNNRDRSEKRELIESKKEFIRAFDEVLESLHSQEFTSCQAISKTICSHKVAFDKFLAIVSKMERIDITSILF